MSWEEPRPLEEITADAWGLAGPAFGTYGAETARQVEALIHEAYARGKRDAVPSELQQEFGRGDPDGRVQAVADRINAELDAESAE